MAGPPELLAPHTIFAFAPAASFQSVGEGAVVLLADSGQLYSCNETSEVFLRHVDGQRPFADIVALFCEEFDVEEAVATEDLSELAQTLVAEGIIRSTR